MESEKVVKKLYLNKATKVLILNAPTHFLGILHQDFDVNPGNVEYDYIQFFAYNLEELDELLALGKDHCKHDGYLWACYPKGTSKLAGEIDRSTIFYAAQEKGLRPVTQIAIDDTWTARRVRPTESVGK